MAAFLTRAILFYVMHRDRDLAKKKKNCEWGIDGLFYERKKVEERAKIREWAFCFVTRL